MKGMSERCNASFKYLIVSHLTEMLMHWMPCVVRIYRRPQRDMRLRKIVLGKIGLFCTCVVAIAFFARHSTAQHLAYGPQHSGLADATLALPLPVSGPNPAALHDPGQLRLALFTTRRYNIAAIKESSLSTTLSIGQIAVAAQIKGLWFDAYRHLLTEASLSYPIRAGTRRAMYVGIRFTSQHTGIAGHGQATKYAFSFGLVAPVLHNIHLGFSAQHILQRDKHLYLPQQIGIGVAARLRDGIWFMGARYHEPGYQPGLHAGLLIRLERVLQLRFGMTTNPARWTSGFGLRIAFIEVHAAVSQHLLLGWTPELSINLVRMRQKEP